MISCHRTIQTSPWLAFLKKGAGILAFAATLAGLPAESSAQEGAERLPPKIARFERMFPAKSFGWHRAAPENVNGSKIMVPKHDDVFGIYKVGATTNFVLELRTFESPADAEAAMEALTKFYGLPPQASVSKDLPRYELARQLSIGVHQVSLFLGRPKYPKSAVLLWKEGQTVFVWRDQGGDTGNAWEEFANAYLAAK